MIKGRAQASLTENEGPHLQMTFNLTGRLLMLDIVMMRISLDAVIQEKHTISLDV